MAEIEISQILTLAWHRLIYQYEKGFVIIPNEKTLEIFFLKNCEQILHENRLNTPVGRQKKFYGKRVDVWIGTDNPSVIELKLFHDPVDWKETKGITNAVETDLNFAKGESRIWVGVIDTIPSVKRPRIQYNIEWNECNIIKKVFDENYRDIAPPSSPKREQKQKWFFVNGSQIGYNSNIS